MRLRRSIYILTALVLVLTLLPPAQVSQAQVEPPAAPQETYVPGELIVGFRGDVPEGASGARASALAASVGAQVVKQVGRAALLSFAPSADVAALAASFAAKEGVAYAEPNRVFWVPENTPQVGAGGHLQSVTRGDDKGHSYTITVKDLLAMRSIKKVGGRTSAAPTYANDIFYNWGNHWIGHSIVWPVANASPVVCVIDSGVDSSHPDLSGKIINGPDLVNDDTLPNDDNGHGTHVAGVIAAKVNNGGLAGISNGKVLAVKALSAQGWGTSADIAAAIYACANNSTVKVINMSLTGQETELQHDALRYAILEKGKLVVAAAGNDSTSDFVNAYPAAWAVGADISGGLISVGAARSPWTEDGLGVLEVDEDGDSNPGTASMSDCATRFTNYGNWVEMAAPGEDIWSTTPVSYPFWMNVNETVAERYAPLNGTSMAAPHVAAAAARAWSLFPKLSNLELADWLMDTGDGLNLAVDPDVTPEEVTDGYNPHDPAGWGNEGSAPFCWPNADGSFTAAENMSQSRYINLARAMNRMAFTASAVDATTGLPLINGQISVIDDATGATRGTSAINSKTNPYVDVINIPATQTEGEFAYRVAVNKTGWTTGAQVYAWADKVTSGGFLASPYLMVGVPPKKNFTVVANWYSPADDPDTVGDESIDLDLYLWLPEGSPDAVVGSGDSGSPDDVEAGNLRDFPRARWNRDGVGRDSVPVESITVVKSTAGAFPWYPGTYDILMKHYVSGDESVFTDSRLNQAGPVVRIWYNGAIKGIRIGPYYYTAVANPSCATDQYWWWAASFGRTGSTTSYQAKNDSLTGSCTSSTFPYAGGGSTIFESKGK